MADGSGTEAEHDELATWRAEVRRYVHRLTGDGDLAEDIAQDSLVRFLSAAGSRSIENPRGWLHRTATNLVRDNARREGVFRRLTLPQGDAPPVPDRELERKDTIRQVRDILDGMTPRDRELLILRESGFRYREIAEILGLRTESIPTYVMRAIHRFRAEYTAKDTHDASL